MLEGENRVGKGNFWRHNGWQYSRLDEIHESSDWGIQNSLNRKNKTKSTPRYTVEKLKNSTDQGKILEATKEKCCKQSKKETKGGYL